MIYNINGIPTDKPIDNQFYISEFQSNYVISDSDITSELDIELVKLRYKVAEMIFGSLNEYNKILPMVPLWIPYAGIDGELKISKVEFEEMLKKNNNPLTHKLLYFNDIGNLIGTLQNSIQESRFLLCEFYKELNMNTFMLQPKPFEPNMVMFASGLLVITLFSKINHLFISLNSQLDFMTKICFELENIQNDFNSYPKLKSNKILYSDSKKLSINKKEGTIFLENDNIRLVQAIRNEIIHNSSFEGISKVYQVFKENDLVEKFIYLPDIKDGRIQSSKNRKRFFNDELKLNERVVRFNLPAHILSDLMVFRSLNS